MTALWKSLLLSQRPLKDGLLMASEYRLETAIDADYFLVLTTPQKCFREWLLKKNYNQK